MTDQEKQLYKRDIEAILFTMGESVPGETLMKALDLNAEETAEVISDLMTDYEAGDRGLKIIRLDDSYQMCTKKECYEALIKVASTPARPNLTGSLLEVLSIVAYKQPVTRGEIERIRGVSSDYAINRLTEYGLIEEMGRAETIGRPILFGTSEVFLRQFGLTSVSDLPDIDADVLMKARETALNEAGIADEKQEDSGTPENPVTVEI